MKKSAVKKSARVSAKPRSTATKPATSAAKRRSPTVSKRHPAKKTLPEQPTPSTEVVTDGRPRCHWARNDRLMCEYHDREWGRPERDSRALWEKLILDGFQAGLSWITILRKREAFRRAYRGFDPEVVAKFTAADVKRLLNDAEIIRSRTKIEASIGSAKAYLAMQAAGEDFSKFVWSFVNDQPIQETRRAPADVPAKTPLSEKVSAELKKRGFKFVGPVIVYAWLQAVGVVNDHVVTCFCHDSNLVG